jgi:hypothetical protein
MHAHTTEPKKCTKALTMNSHAAYMSASAPTSMRMRYMHAAICLEEMAPSRTATQMHCMRTPGTTRLKTPANDRLRTGNGANTTASRMYTAH